MRPFVSTGDAKIDAAIRVLYEEVKDIADRTGTPSLSSFDNYEGKEGQVVVMKGTGGEYALHAKGPDGWLTSTNIEFVLRNRTEVSRKVDPELPAPHASTHAIIGGTDPITITSLSMGAGTAGTWLEGDGTWSDPGAGGGITSLQGDTGTQQTGSNQTLSATSDTNVTLSIASGGVLNDHMFTAGWSGTLAEGRLGSHDIVSKHTASGLTTGHVLQATGTATFGFAALPAHNQSASTITSGTFASLAQYQFQDNLRVDGMLGIGRTPTTYAIELNGSIAFYGTNLITNAGTGHVTWAGDPISASYIGTHSHTEGDITDGAVLARVGSTEVVTGSWTFQNADYYFGDSTHDTTTTISRSGIVGGVKAAGTPPTVEVGLLLKQHSVPTSGQAYSSPAIRFETSNWSDYPAPDAPATNIWEIFNWGFDTTGTSGGVLTFNCVRPEVTVTPHAFDEAGRVLLGYLKFQGGTHYGFRGENFEENPHNIRVFCAGNTLIGWPTNGITSNLFVSGDMVVGYWGTGQLKLYDDTDQSHYAEIQVGNLTGNRILTIPAVASDATFITTQNLTSITTVGTVTAGAWQSSTQVGTAYGGTGLTSFTANGFAYASSTSVLATTSSMSTDGSIITKYNNQVTEGVGHPYILDYAQNETYDAISATNCSNTTPTGAYRVSAHVWASQNSTNATFTVKVTFKDVQSNIITEDLCSIQTTNIGTAAGHSTGTYTLYHNGGGTVYVQWSITKSGGDVDDGCMYLVVCERLN